MAGSMDPKVLDALVKASRIARPGRIEWDLEHFLIESESACIELKKAREPEKEPLEQPHQDLVDFLKEYQEQNHISVRDLAKEISLSRTTLRTFLEAGRNAQPTTVQRIRRFKNKIEQSKSI